MDFKKRAKGAVVVVGAGSLVWVFGSTFIGGCNGTTVG